MDKYRLKCENCGNVYSQDSSCLHCGGTVQCFFDFSKSSQLQDTLFCADTFWDYLPLLPVLGEQPISLGEGSTPLVSSSALAKEFDIKTLNLKCEGNNPTGSFKDRCLSIALTKVREKRVDSVVIGSAGNAGAAAAAYAARAAIACYIFVPECTPLERIAQSLAYGAYVVRVEKGDVTDCIALSQKVGKEYGWPAVTTAIDCNPYQAEAVKTIAYEMAKSMNFDVPDWIIVPVGGGGCLTGIYRGYKDLLTLGLVSKIPGMIGVQEKGCSPLVKAFRESASPEEIQREDNASGTALPILDSFPLDGRFALQAIYDSAGYAISVSSHELITAQMLLASREGIFAEIASASTIAALGKLRSEERIAREDSVVCIITGNGLKDPSVISKYLAQPPLIQKSVSAFQGLLKGSGTHRTKRGIL